MPADIGQQFESTPANDKPGCHWLRQCFAILSGNSLSETVAHEGMDELKNGMREHALRDSANMRDM